MRLAIVVQRYGAEINGGAELHARYIAERLAAHAEVRVFTTCARDYVTWRDAYPSGVDRVNGITVERFPVTHERDADIFGRHSTRVFLHWHSFQQEIDWLNAEGPVSTALLTKLESDASAFDFAFVFSLRYHHAYHAARLLADRAILVPTVEREAAIGLGLFPPILRGVRAIMYNSPEERALIHALSGNEQVPGVVVGVGSDIPSAVDAGSARVRFGLTRPYLLYVGRIDANKGCAELFDHFEQLTLRQGRPVDLVLVGAANMPVPQHPRVRHLGFLSDRDKFDVLAGATALVVPSYFESLSMVAIEAWALGIPVVANARCDVLVGQCLRSQAGLYYHTAEEFLGICDRLLTDPGLTSQLAANGRAYHAAEYSWPVIEQKYLEMLTMLSRHPGQGRMAAEPGWLSRRRRVLAPAADVVSALPTGPSLDHSHVPENGVA
jgi:glycosyltransferase involved in cell wall biosynthesis